MFSICTELVKFIKSFRWSIQLEKLIGYYSFNILPDVWNKSITTSENNILFNFISSKISLPLNS